MKPQRIVWDLQRALAPDAIVICDVGAHKMWMARMYQPERPEHVHHLERLRRDGHRPARRDRRQAGLSRADRASTVTGDGGFMMNCQEIETALRHRHADRHRDLERQRLRADRVASVAAFRPAEQRRTSAIPIS